MSDLGLLVPITALMIPIVAITVHSPIGRALARRLESGTSPAVEEELTSLRQRVNVLETRALEQNTQVQQLQESSEFYKQLLESREDQKRLSAN